MASKIVKAKRQARGLNVMKVAGTLPADPAKFAKAVKEGKLSPKAAAQVAVNLAREWDDIQRAKAERMAQEKKARAGIRLTETQARDAVHALMDVNCSLVSAVTLAQQGIDHNNTEPAIIALESIAKVACRKLDAVAQLLGDAGLGSFEAELSGKPEGLAQRN